MNDFWAHWAAVSFAIFPGIGWIRRGISSSRLGWIGLVCAFSVGFNSYVLMLLAMAGWYTPAASRWWCAALVALTAAGFAANRWRSPQRKDERTGSENLKGPASLLILPILLLTAYKSLLLPFYSWDAIASWDRWARNFLAVPDFFNTQSFFYPLHMSLGMSFPYMVSRDPTTELAAHSLSFVHILILCGGVVLLSVPLRIPYQLVFAGSFVTAAVASMAATGYADIASTGFAVCALGLYLRAVMEEGGGGGFWAGLAAGTSVLFKQSPVVVLVSLPILVFLLLGRDRRRKIVVQSIQLGGGFLLVTLPWALSPHTELTGSQLKLVTRDIHGGASAGAVFSKGFQNLVEATTTISRPSMDWAILIAAAALFTVGAAVSPLARAVGISALALLAIWINTANYDTRAAMLSVPMVVSVALVGFLWLARRRLSEGGLKKALVGLTGLSVAVFVFGDLTGNRTWRGERLTDWRPGNNWHQVSPLASREEKLALMVPGYQDLLAWKNDHRHFEGVVWSSPVLRAAAFPDRYDGGGRWTGILPGQWQAQTGDVILMPREELGQTVAGKQENWEQWLAELVNQGILQRKEPVGTLEVYAVVAYPASPINR